SEVGLECLSKPSRRAVFERGARGNGVEFRHSSLPGEAKAGPTVREGGETGQRTRVVRARESLTRTVEEEVTLWGEKQITGRVNKQWAGARGSTRCNAEQRQRGRSGNGRWVLSWPGLP